MYCPKCGNRIENNAKFCPRCGNSINIVNNNITAKKSHKIIPILITSFVLVLSVIIGFITIKGMNGRLFISNDGYTVDDNPKKNGTTGKYSTIIVTDNVYSGVTVGNKQDAYDLIAKDSVTQKDKCPDEIKGIEDEIINNYGITAVNLCEMDTDFARELGNVFKKIYTEFPSVRGYLTNMSLTNASMNNSYIAAFMPVFNFATSSSSSTYPWVIKSQILLNTRYFLNKDLLKKSTESGSKSGHFPPNATIYSPVAHELGHYLSFLAMMKHYNISSVLLIDNDNIDNFYNLYEDFKDGNFSLEMINEAYDNYRKDTGTTLSLDDWRATISHYAVTKDNDGNYIYDETIAESFHDSYLNGDNAKDASKYIVSVLKSKLES